MLKRALGVVLAGVVAAGAGAAIWVSDFLTPAPVPDLVFGLEDAMATSGLVGVAHFDMGHALEVESFFLGEGDEGALPASAGTDSLFSDLLREDLDLAASVEHVVAAVVLSEEEAGFITAITGPLPIDEIWAALAERYTIEEDGERYRLTGIDAETCLPLDAIGLMIYQDSILFGTPSLVARVVERLEAGSEAETDLSAWRSFRRGRTASVGVMRPGEVAGAVENPFARMAVQQLSPELEPVQAFYLGTRFAALPPGIEVASEVIADRASWADEQVDRYRAWESALDEEFGDRLPALSEILARFKLDAREGRLSAQLRLDRDFAKQVGDVVGDIATMAFGGMGFVSGVGEQDAEEKTIEAKDLTIVRPTVSLASLAAADISTRPGAVLTGPFSVQLETRRILPERDDIVELEIAAHSSAIPNLVTSHLHRGDEARLRLFVTSVVDRSGSELLAEERCGSQLNDDPADFQTGTDTEYVDNAFVKVAPTHWAKKSVRLAAGRRAEEIAAIEGKVVLRLPTQVEIVRLEQPFAGQILESEGVRVAMVPSDESRSVSYEISGDSDRILEIRGLNAAGQYLATGSASGSGRLFRPGKKVRRDFKGEVAALEFVMVKQEEVSTHAFRVDSFEDHYGDWRPEERPPLQAQSRQQFRREVAGHAFEADTCTDRLSHTQLSAFEICLTSTRAGWGSLMTQLEIYAPPSPGLQANLSALEIVLEGVEIQNPGASSFFIATDVRQFLSPSLEWGKEHLMESVYLHTLLDSEGPELGEGKVALVRGQLIHRLPGELDTLSLDISRLGNQKEFSNGFQMQLVSIGMGKIQLQMHGERAHVIQIVVRDEEGEAMAIQKPQFTAANETLFGEKPTEEDGFRVSVSITGPGGKRPHTFEVLYARSLDEEFNAFALPAQTPSALQTASTH